MIEKILLETERLILKAPTPEFFDLFHRQNQDPLQMEFFAGTRDEKKSREVFNMVMEHYTRYGLPFGPVYLKKTGEFIGRTGLFHLDFKDVPDIEIGYILLPEYWNKGFATELANALFNYAFQELNAPRIFATIDPKNIGSTRIAEKLGMTIDRVDTYTTLNKEVNFYVKYKEENNPCETLSQF